jgi:hypothetical protein
MGLEWYEFGVHLVSSLFCAICHSQILVGPEQKVERTDQGARE